MRSFLSASATLVCVGLGAVAPVEGRDANLAFSFFTSLPPNAVSTMPYSLNKNGEIAGSYVDTGGVMHGFVRSADGTITSFDPDNAVVTFSTCINKNDATTGIWQDGSGTVHGFVRSADGTITTFDPGEPLFTYPTVINEAGQIAGYYQDSSEALHGFIRDSDGSITVIDVSGAGDTYMHGTLLFGMNKGGASTGYIITPKGAYVSFVRSASGGIEKFTASSYGTMPSAIDERGGIIGGYDTRAGAARGFFRTPDGKMERFAAKGANNYQFQGTAPHDFGDGMIVGSYLDDHSIYHGFLRTPDGDIERFDAPTNVCAYGTVPLSASRVADELEIAGYCYNEQDIAIPFTATRTQ